MNIRKNIIRAALCLVIAFYFQNNSFGQIIEIKQWCLSRCDLVGDERINTELMHLKLLNDSIKDEDRHNSVLRFPLRIAIVQSDSVELHLNEVALNRAIFYLNKSFMDASFVFYIDRVDVIISELHLEDLSDNQYQVYNDFADTYDHKDMITIYIFDHGENFCHTTPTSISCGRTGGFSYVLSNRTSSIVLSKFDLSDQKVVAHEVGHFFGLYHTFEESQFGKDDSDPDLCWQQGDRICDTPADPGGIYEIYINYSTCEMLGLKTKLGTDYKPLVNNYMSYYKPCYLKEYEFTPEQLRFMNTAGNSELRNKYTR